MVSLIQKGGVQNLPETSGASRDFRDLTGLPGLRETSGTSRDLGLLETSAVDGSAKTVCVGARYLSAVAVSARG